MRIRETYSDLAADIAAGRMADFADYKYQCGRVRSFLDVLEMIEEVEKEEK